jgi:uncharacterized protein (TIGR03085 family)
MEHHAVDERHELSETLRAAGPDAPTLCGDWSTKVLAAHLVQRERSLIEAAGRLPVARLRRRANLALVDLANREPYEQLVSAVENGPSWSESGRFVPLGAVWSMPAVREAVNLVEYLIHHEDVRRAVPGAAPRQLPAGRVNAVWRRLRFSAPLTMRAVPVGVRLSWPGHGEIRTRRDPAVTVTGEPVELALVAFGRQPVANVAYDGPPAAVALVSGAKIAI